MRPVWIDLRTGREGFGATPPVHAEPGLTAPDMGTFAVLAAQRAKLRAG